MKTSLLLFVFVFATALGRVSPASGGAGGPPSEPSAVARTIPDTVRFDQEIADGDLIHMTVTNYGFYGNNFFNRSASLEYPAGRGYEHMVHGGLWVGARARDSLGEFVGVTSGVVDVAQGPTSPDMSEWTPADRGIRRRSTLVSSPYYDPLAVSEMDLVCDYNDISPTRAAGNFEDHRSMRLEVHQETYQWSFGDLQNVVFVHATITNRGPLLTNAWFGFYSELASGNKGAYVNWPPSGGDPSGQGGWFTNKWIVYDESRRLLREHYCDAPPLPPGPTGCRLERAPYWIGVQLLTRPDPGAGQRVTVAAWSWSPASPYRDQDVERYDILSRGTIQSLDGDSLLPSTGDPVELIGIGPFARIENDSSVSVDFALVGGAEVDSIWRNAEAAQSAYDQGFTDVAVPTLVSPVLADATQGRVRLEWSISEFGVTALLERRLEGGRWLALERVKANGSGRITFEDRDVVPGARYGYRLRTADGVVLGSSEVWVLVDAESGLAIEAPRPHPTASAEMHLAFSLPLAAPAMLDIVDIAGRRVWSRQWAVPGVGRHTVRIESLPPGVYVVRLQQGARATSTRVVVTR